MNRQKDSTTPTSPALLNGPAGALPENGSRVVLANDPGGGGGGEYQGDAVEDLAAMLDSAGARATFDRGRNSTHPCTFCGKSPASGAHQLLTIGRYLDGTELTRPVCSGCVLTARVRMGAKPNTLPATIAQAVTAAVEAGVSEVKLVDAESTKKQPEGNE